VESLKDKTTTGVDYYVTDNKRWRKRQVHAFSRVVEKSILEQQYKDQRETYVLAGDRIPEEESRVHGKKDTQCIKRRQK